MSVPTGLEFPGEVGTLKPGGAAGDFKALSDQCGKAGGRGRGSQAPCTALSDPLSPEATYQPPKLLAQLMSLRPTKSKETGSSNSGLSSQRSGS